LQSAAERTGKASNRQKGLAKLIALVGLEEGDVIDLVFFATQLKPTT
jgi:hypothetical protein